MKKLIAELQRLYFRPGQLNADRVADDLAGGTSVALDLVDADGRVRAMVVRFKGAADWEPVARLHHAVQGDLELPAPAISVSGRAGYRLWFSLAEPVAVEQAATFLDALRGRYLAELPRASLVLHPDADGPDSAAQATVPLAPAIHPATGKWSAFIDPSMGGMFIDAPGLEMAPNMDKQADILAGLDSIGSGDFERALDLLRSRPRADAAPGDGPTKQSADPQSESGSGPGPGARRTRFALNVGNDFTDPRSFLLAVMNDPTASARQRIRAAKALLPYFVQVPPK